MTNTVLYITEPVLSVDTIGMQHCYLVHDGEIEQGDLSAFSSQLHEKSVAVVLSVADTTLTQVELNRKQARHMQSVLPYILEESLLAAPETLWFSYQSPKRGVSQYPVVVCNKAPLERLYAYFQEHHCYVTGVYVDAQLWQQHAPAIIAHDATTLILQSAHQALAVPSAQLDPSIQVLGVEWDEAAQLQVSSELLLALHEAILNQAVVNLLHDELPPMSSSAQQLMWREWKPVTYFAASIVVVIGALLMLQTQQYQGAAKQAQQEAVALYQELFPQASRPQLLQREFENQLRRLQGTSSGSSAFLSLMTPVAKQLSHQDFNRLQPLRFQFDEREASLSFDITAPEFAQIEKLRSQLQSQGMEVSIGNSRSADTGVTARLKVEQAS